MVSNTCNEQRIHPGRGLVGLEEFGEIFLREWGLPSTLALHILLLATLLVLKSKGNDSFFLIKKTKTLCTQMSAHMSSPFKCGKTMDF